MKFAILIIIHHLLFISEYQFGVLLVIKEKKKYSVIKISLNILHPFSCMLSSSIIHNQKKVSKIFFVTANMPKYYLILNLKYFYIYLNKQQNFLEIFFHN